MTLYKASVVNATRKRSRLFVELQFRQSPCLEVYSLLEGGIICSDSPQIRSSTTAPIKNHCSPGTPGSLCNCQFAR